MTKAFREELAWAAGFFDGEGCALAKPNRSTMLTISQVDLRPLQRFHDAVTGIGRIYGPKTSGRTKNARPIYVWSVQNFEGVQIVAAFLWKWLSEPKREAVRRMLLTVRGAPFRVHMRRRVRCSRGHLFTEENTYVRPSTGDRYCRVCKNEGRRRRLLGSDH